MGKTKKRLKAAQEDVQKAVNKTNKKIEELGSHTSVLYDALCSIQSIFDKIRNLPDEEKLEYEKIKEITLQWKQQVETIEKDHKNAMVKGAGAGIAGAGLGVAVVAIGPTAAMGVATTFGVASTGTAISSLSGAAATNAALAWLGGGALAAGGGGMAAGEAFLALAGPIGWTIAGVSVLVSGILFWKSKSDIERILNVFILISERDIKSYELAIVELNERIARIKDENQKLIKAVEKIKSFGFDYSKMTEEQQYELGAYVNLMLSSTQLLVNPIIGLQPKYTGEDFDKFLSWSKRKTDIKICHEYKDIIISLSNLLCKISLDDKDKNLLWKSFRKNKKMLEGFHIKKKEFDFDTINAVCEALGYKYSLNCL